VPPDHTALEVHQLVRVLLSVWLVAESAVESCMEKPLLPGQAGALLVQEIWSIV